MTAKKTPVAGARAARRKRERTCRARVRAKVVDPRINASLPGSIFNMFY
jgi:hypothetical protein